MAGDILGRHAQRTRADIPGSDPNLGRGLGNGNRHGAATGAKIDDPPGGRMGVQPVNGQLDQEFALRSRNQHGGVDRQHVAVELALSGQVRHRNASGSATRQPAQAASLRLRQSLLGVTVQPLARDVEHVRDQDLGVEPGV